MAFPVAAVIGGVSSILGGLFGSSSAKSQAEIAWEHQKELAQNKHQWEVEDLKAAGLNPVLSATGGSGASTSSVPVADTASPISKAAQGVANALQLGILDSQVQKNKADAELAQASAESAKADANAKNTYQREESYARISKLNSDINVNTAECGKIIAQTNNYNALTAESQKKLQLYGQQIINLVEEQKNIIKQGRAIDESAFASHASGINSLASASVSVQTASLISKQTEGQTLSNTENAIITQFAKEHPALYTYAKTAKSPSAMVGILAGSGIDLYNAMSDIWKKVIKRK